MKSGNKVRISEKGPVGTVERTEEDNGVVKVFVHWPASKTNSLVIYDSRKLVKV